MGQVQVNPQWCATASSDLLGDEFWILTFEVNVRPKFGLLKCDVPPATAHLGERRDTPDGGCRGVACRRSNSEGEYHGEDALREPVDWSLAVEQRADLF